MLFRSVLHPQPGCPLLSAPRGISPSHASHPGHAQGSTGEKGRAATIFTWILLFQQEGAVFCLPHRWLQTGMLSKGAPQHPQCVNMHVDLQMTWSCPSAHEDLHLSQMTELRNCAGNGLPRTVPSARAPLQKETFSGRLFLPSFWAAWSLGARISGCHPVLRPLVVYRGTWRRGSLSGKEAPELHFCSVGRNEGEEKKGGIEGGIRRSVAAPQPSFGRASCVCAGRLWLRAPARIRYLAGMM